MVATCGSLRWLEQAGGGPIKTELVQGGIQIDVERRGDEERPERKSAY